MLEAYIVDPYIRAIVTFLAVFVILKIFLYIVGKVLPRFASGTKTTLDDVILQKTTGPLTWIAALIGVRFAIGEINLEESLSGTIEGIVLTFLIFIGGVLVYHILNALITIGFTDFGGKAKQKANESLLMFFHSIFTVVIFVVVFLLILASWGVEIGPLLAGLGVAGLAIAFALQSTLANIFGGISMILDKSIQIGDAVKLDDGTGGEILKINLRSTKIQTYDNELVIVPNGKLSESNIQNVALPKPKARVVVPFGVAYGSNVEKVKKLVMAELKKIDGFVDDDSASVKFILMADSSLNFNAYFYIADYREKMSALDEANSRIYAALNKAGVEIPFPQIDVNLKKK